MQLKKYLEKEGLIIKTFAKKLGMTEQLVQLIFKNKHDIRLSNAIKIVTATVGEVSYLELAKKEKKDLKKSLK